MKISSMTQESSDRFYMFCFCSRTALEPSRCCFDHSSNVCLELVGSTVYSMLGGIIASSIGFIVARWLAQDWVRKRLPQRFIGWEKRFVKNALLSTIALRVVTGYAPAADWFLGITNIKWREFFIGTVIGLSRITFLFRFTEMTPFGGCRCSTHRLAVVIGVVLLLSAVKRHRKRTEAI